MPAWFSILLGVLGALIGAAGAVGAQWVSAYRQETRDARERQFDAGADLLSAADSFVAAAYELRRFLLVPELHNEAQGVYERYTKRWDGFVDRVGPARIAAPPEVVTAASAFEAQLHDLAAACGVWYVEYLRDKAGTEHHDACDDGLRNVAERRRTYVQVFRAHFPEYGYEPGEAPKSAV